MQCTFIFIIPPHANKINCAIILAKIKEIIENRLLCLAFWLIVQVSPWVQWLLVKNKNGKVIFRYPRCTCFV